MPLVNENKEFCYRITHIDNLPLIIRDGICAKNHENASEEFVPIGNPDIIAKREDEPVKIEGFGNLSDYVPFYFTPRSVMLYNILTGYYEPIVKKRAEEEILVIRCRITNLFNNKKCFFTDAMASVNISKHYDDLKNINEINWHAIHNSDFQNTIDNLDKRRKYQAEFLVYNHVPLDLVESLHVYDEDTKQFVKQELNNAGRGHIPVKVTKFYYFRNP